MILWPFSLPFNVQVMTPVGFYWFFNFASVSIVGCYLYIIIHYDMSLRDCRKGLVPKGGRPDPELFKAIDTYAYIKKYTNNPYVP